MSGVERLGIPTVFASSEPPECAALARSTTSGFRAFERCPIQPVEKDRATQR